jgi:hypothetical protein
VHGELAALGIKIAASTVWGVLRDPRYLARARPRAHHLGRLPQLPGRGHLAADFLETRALTGATLTVLAVIEHAIRRVRVLGVTARPTAAWVTQVARSLAMDLQDAGARIEYPIRGREVRYPTGFDAVLADEGVEVVRTGVRMPRMNAIMERWIRSRRTELLERTLIWNHAHLTHAPREYERFHNQHRPHRTLAGAASLRPLPEPLETDQLVHLDVRGRDRLGGTLREYQHAA